jgi:hypothetical protein
MRDAPSTQRFWSFEKKVGVSIFAAQITADAITTQIGLNRGFREVNPVLRPLVKKGTAGEAAATVLGFGAGLGAVYLLHATHHYRAERITLRLFSRARAPSLGTISPRCTDTRNHLFPVLPLLGVHSSKSFYLLD